MPFPPSGDGRSGRSWWVSIARSTARNSSRSRKAFTGLDHLARLCRRQVQPVDQDLRGHVVDVDQAAVIEPARQLRVADAQLTGQRDITGRDRPGLLAPVSGGRRSGERRLLWSRGREHAGAQHKRMGRPDDHQRKGHGPK